MPQLQHSRCMVKLATACQDNILCAVWILQQQLVPSQIWGLIMAEASIPDGQRMQNAHPEAHVHSPEQLAHLHELPGS